MDDATENGFRPPYFSFATFWGYCAELAQRPLPPRIDRSMMRSKSGTDQANLFSCLKAFSLIDSENRVQPRLTHLTIQDEEQRKQALADLVRQYYPKQINVSNQHGSETMLWESFTEAFGITSADTRRKAATFFLHASRTAGLPLSENFPKLRPGSGAPGTSKAKKPSAGSGAVVGDPPISPGSGVAGPASEVVAASFGAAGTVTMTVDVRWLSLDVDTFTKLRKLIKDIEALGAPAHDSPASFDVDSPIEPEDDS